MLSYLRVRAFMVLFKQCADERGCQLSGCEKFTWQLFLWCLLLMLFCTLFLLLCQGPNQGDWRQWQGLVAVVMDDLNMLMSFPATALQSLALTQILLTMQYQKCPFDIRTNEVIQQQHIQRLTSLVLFGHAMNKIVAMCLNAVGAMRRESTPSPLKQWWWKRPPPPPRKKWLERNGGKRLSHRCSTNNIRLIRGFCQGLPFLNQEVQYSSCMTAD